MIALFGHNVAETQTVLWTRMLDRLAGPNPPRIVCVDPRQTPVARAATVHLAPRPGTNVMLMNALLHEIVDHDWVDHDYVGAPRRRLRRAVQAARQGLPPGRPSGCATSRRPGLREAAEILGTGQRLLSHGAPGLLPVPPGDGGRRAGQQPRHRSAACSGKPGCGVLQMNGQPTAQNTRECGADGDLAGFRNWANDAHVAELAGHWNIDPRAHPALRTAPTHLMQIMRYAEDGSIRFLWVNGTNPAVSLPELSRVRSILAQERLFLVVQDLFLTETAQLADVVLPAATWGEKTGTFTNVDRTVHLSEKAVDPPGQARPDLDIFIDFAHRLGLEDKDGQPLVKWSDAGGRVRRVARVQPRATVRLLRHDLRRPARRQRHPVALHGREPRRDRASLRGRRLLECARPLRDLRQATS